MLVRAAADPRDFGLTPEIAMILDWFNPKS